jgi:serine/threonine protein kinase
MSYRILCQLGGGGFSEVFEIEDLESALPERLILKRLNAGMSARPEVRAAFAEEARILRELKHPNVVTFRRCYIDESQQVCLVMEKVSGEPLDVWAKRCAARPEEVLDLFERILSAVDYLHHRASPFLHLDLKPENILVASINGIAEPVLIDFGIARRSGGAGLKAYTPPYGAPEQEAGKLLDRSTDVYALGQILAELIDLLGAETREALLAVAAKARSTSQKQRYMDAGAMKLALRQARKRASPASPALTSRPGRPIQSRWLLMGAAGALVVLFALVAALWPSAPALQPPAASTDARGRFSDSIEKARKATFDGRFDSAEDHYASARRVWESIPGDDKTGKAMERELVSLRSQIDMVRQGGIEGERVRLDLQ